MTLNNFYTQAKKLAQATLSAALVTSLFATAGSAQDYPSSPITMLIGAGAGGSTDTGGRILATAIEKHLGQSVVVINKPGGGGAKAAIELKRADPDGYTLAFAYSHHISFVPQFNKDEPPYNVSDFSYIGSITHPYHSVVSLSGQGWTTLDEMVAKFKADGKPIRFVYSAGPGRLVGEAIAAGYDIDVKIIRVKGGGASMAQVLGGHVDMAFTGGAHNAYTSVGEMIVLGTVDTERNGAFPDAATLMEVGVQASTPALQILLAPKGIPADVQEKLAAALEAVRNDPAIVALYQDNLNMAIDDKGPDTLREYMFVEELGYGELIADFSGE